MKTLIRASLISLCALALAPSAQAAWPDKPIRLIVPAAPGGTTDITARLLSEKLGAELGTTVVVENRAGAAGIIGTQALLQSAPDGYTIGFGNIGPNGINYSLYKKLPYKHTDFSPITLVISVPNVLVVNSKSPYKTVKDLVDAIKNDPKGNYSFASSGTGQSPHMSAEMFKAMTKTSMTHIPYRGAAPAVNDLLAGQVQVTIGVVNQLIPHIRAGKLKALGVTTRKRLAQMPDVPTLDEAGVPGYESEIWLGLAAPSATPPAIIEQINQAIRKAMATADVISKLQSQGIDVVVSSPDQMRQRGLEDLKRWGDIIRTAGIKVD